MFQYSVVRITDGDTFVATDSNISFKVRIAGMDAPEKAQSYGKVAKSALSTIISGKRVTIKTVGSGMDQYGRVLGIVFVNGEDVAENMIEQGLATYYPLCRPHSFCRRPLCGPDKIIVADRPINLFRQQSVLVNHA